MNNMKEKKQFGWYSDRVNKLMKFRRESARRFEGSGEWCNSGDVNLSKINWLEETHKYPR